MNIIVHISIMAIKIILIENDKESYRQHLKRFEEENRS